MLFQAKRKLGYHHRYFNVFAFHCRRLPLATILQEFVQMLSNYLCSIISFINTCILLQHTESHPQRKHKFYFQFMMSLSNLLPSSNKPNSPTDSESTIASELERLTLQEISVINARDFSLSSIPAQELLSHVAADYRVYSPSFPKSTWDQAVQHWKQTAVNYPNFHINVTNISSTVNVKEGWATVHIQSYTTGLGEATRFGWVSRRCWRREKGEGEERWMMFETVSIRGTESLMGFV